MKGLEDFGYKKPPKQQEKGLAWWSHKKKWKRRKESKRKMRGVALGLLDVVSKRTQSWLLFSVKGEGKKAICLGRSSYGLAKKRKAK